MAQNSPSYCYLCDDPFLVDKYLTCVSSIGLQSHLELIGIQME